LNMAVPLKTSSLALQDVVDISALQRIQDTFSKAMGVAAVTVDRKGVPVTRNSGFRRICKMIRSTGRGLTRCMECDAEGGLAAKERGNPTVYVCKGGLMDMAAPITINGEYIGSMMAGQVVPYSQREDFLEEILVRNSNLGLPLPDLRNAVQEIPSMPREQVDAAGEMLFQMANYIVEIGVANITQAKLLREERERAALQMALQDAQLHMLESQIAPHFLFNALGLISYTALQENASQTEEIAYALSDLLRYSLRNNRSMPVTLRQELEVVEHYLRTCK
jgi:two-component system LytT family sensor kinase